MTVRNQNVKVHRGNSLGITVTVTQADGTPYDPSLGAEFRYRVALTSHAADDEAYIRKSLGHGITAGTGSVAIAIDPEDTDLEPGVYYHELRIWEGTDVATAMYGAFIVKKALPPPLGDIITPLKANVTMSASVPTRSP